MLLPRYEEPESAESYAARLSKEPRIITFTGRRVNPLALRPEDICIEDIAHHLATQNRWCGALREPISIAQHSCHVSCLLQGTGEELEGLMHDDDEAYLGDMTKWLKQSPGMAEYRAAGDRAHIVCAQALGYSPVISDAVRRADARMISIEAGFGISGWTEQPGYPPASASELDQAVFTGAWDWRRAEQMFLTTFNILMKVRRTSCS